MFKKNQIIKQIVKKSSSETTREAPLQIDQFNFHDYLLTELPEHIIEIDLIFLQWLIGFTEGNGTFCYRLDSGRLRFIFEIAQKEPKVLYSIKKKLGFGKVSSYVQKEQMYYKFVVEKKRNLQRIMVLFNGNLVLPKRRIQYENWIEKAASVNFLPPAFILKTSHGVVSLDSAWLSGFIDAEGCFYAATSIASLNNRNLVTRVLRQKIHITQQDKYGEKAILGSIGALFNAKSKIAMAKKPDVFRIEISSLESHLLVVDYLEKFPLRTIKYIAFHRWRRIVNARVLGLHLIELNIPKITRLCEAINSFSKKDALPIK